MDRRSLLFILIVSLSFFGIRTWYEKRHEERQKVWQQQQASIEKRPKLAPETYGKENPPALFDIPIVCTIEKRRALLETSADLLDSVVVEEISETANRDKSAYGVEIGKGLFALLSKEPLLVWPETIEVQYIKNQSLAQSTPARLIDSANTSYAIYTTQEKQAAVQIGTAVENEFLYAIHAFKKPLSDPESYQITPVRIQNNVLIDLQGSPFQAQESFIVSKRSLIVPIGVALQNQGVVSFANNRFISQSAIIEKEPQNFPTPQYYVIENGYQQLVFSTENGSLIEINLPFHSAANPKSLVRPTAFDNAITQTSSKNALFPLHNSLKNAQQKIGGYYPLLRRSLMSDDADETIIAQVLPQFEALQILRQQGGKYGIDPIFYRMTSHTREKISFIGVDQKGREITKSYSFPQDIDSYPYCIDLDISIQGGSLNQGEMALTTGVPEIEWMSGANGASLGMCLTKNGSPSLERIDLPKEPYLSQSQKPNWIFNSNGFFAFIIKPLSSTFKGVSFEKAPGSDAPSRLVELDENRSKTEEDLPGYQAALIMNNNRNHTIRFYAGPLDETALSAIDSASTKEFGSSFEYSQALTYQGWFTFISEPFARLLYFFMKQFHRFVGSWGLSIVFATIILRVLLYPLNSWSMKSMKKMQEVSPLAQALQEKYKKDPTKLQKEMLALYKEKGVNPFSGCLPLLIQMPFLIGMFDLLKSSFALRGAPFIPGWINDLSAPDVLFTFPIHLPILGQEMHLLPILLGFIMWIQQAMSSTLPKNPEDWTDQQKQQKSMGLIMTLVMTIMFYNFPSGLNIYWTSSILLGIAQQWWMGRGIAHKK